MALLGGHLFFFLSLKTKGKLRECSPLGRSGSMEKVSNSSGGTLLLGVFWRRKGSARCGLGFWASPCICGGRVCSKD